jgi:ATP synthase protein I
MAQNVNSDGKDGQEQEKANQALARDDAALQARLNTLTSALDERQRRPAAGEADLAGQPIGRAINLGFRVLTEFVTAIVVAAVIGWQLDAWFHTGPILLIVFLCFGTGAGFLNVYRIAAKPTGPKRDSD